MTDDALAARLRALFTEELDEQVQQLNDDLLALERTPGDAERLRAVFRVMHTLKGAARSAGLPRVEELCHALENELGYARDGKMALHPGQIALLFEAADALGQTRDMLREGKGESDAVLGTVLHRARRGATATPVASRPVAAAPAAPAASAASAASAVPAPAPIERIEHGQVRVTLQQVEAIVGAAGEVAGLAAVLSERTEGLAAMRARRRAEPRRGPSDDAFDQELTRLLRKSSEDARALAAVSGRLGASARHLRQRPFSEVADTLPRVARDVARDIGKQVRVVITGGETEADRVVLEALREPLLHLIRNAVDHGIEHPDKRVQAGKNAEGVIHVTALLNGDRLHVTIADDGHGLDLDAVRRGLERRGSAVPADAGMLTRVIFDDGFTTREAATKVSGRGVGMGIVRAAAERMGGTVDVASDAGKGTWITIDVPVSIATMRVVLVDVGGVTLGIPSAFVVRVARVDPRTLAHVDGRAMLLTPSRPIPLTTLASLLGPPYQESAAAAMLQAVIVESGGRRLAIVVDDLLDERELVLRPLEHAGREASNATAGTAVLGTGVVSLVLSVPALLDQSEGSGGRASGGLTAASTAPRAPARILVVDDSITSRTLEQSVLSAAGYDVLTAVDGADAWRTLEREHVALVVSDVEMPHLNGFELCERIRANPRTAALPLILVTSLDEPAQRAHGLEVGANAYITKSSFDQDTLLDTVRMLIGREPMGDA
ncbi:MAG: cheA [Gemmatimonadetes bacterium]|nr:cheA [Gemmatimonadota bacterium]